LDNIEKNNKNRSKPDSQSLADKISSALVRMDLLLKENFELKREIVFERKKYMDLQTSYNDLKNNMQTLGGDSSSNSVNQVYSPDKNQRNSMNS